MNDENISSWNAAIEAAAKEVIEMQGPSRGRYLKSVLVALEGNIRALVKAEAAQRNLPGPLERMVALDEQLELEQPGWMTGDAPMSPSTPPLSVSPMTPGEIGGLRGRVAQMEALLVEAADALDALHAKIAELEGALTKISAIRDSIVGVQGFNWSEHAYPLVAVLDAAGYPGAGYKIARENVGTLIEQIKQAEAERDAASARVGEMREALEPFAREAAAQEQVTSYSSGDCTIVRTNITIGDLRRARLAGGEG